MDWGETKNILLELEQLFSRENDISDVIDISKMAREIEVHRDSNLKSTKELIKCATKRYTSSAITYFPIYLFAALTATVAEKESEILAPSAV